MARSNLLSRYVLVLLILVILTGCGGSSAGGGGGGGGGTAVEIKLKVPPSEERRSHKVSFAPSLSSVARVRISVADQAGKVLASAETPTAGGVAPDQVVPLQLDVPIGPARLFRAEALELSGKILFEGEASADILIGLSVTIPIEIKPAPILSITPATATVLAGKTVPFIPVVTELEDRSVIWSVNEIEGGNDLLGTITPATEGDQAIYTAPATPPTPNVVTIKATAKVRPDRFATASVTVLSTSQGVFVNGEAGGDLPDCGAEASPCRTLTQGVGKATEGQVVVVAPGTYRFGSTAGEPLPLMMKRGVTIQGSGADQTTLELHLLQFGGEEGLPTRENAAIIGADQATLTRFTIQMNDCPGAVILLRDVSPVISENTFLGNFLRCSTAIRLLGKSAPVILGNRFGAVEREFNVALSVEEAASPAILQNTLTGNLTAVRTSQRATARIEENTITQNGTGMLIEDDSNPDLGGGAKGSTGGNTLSCNTEADLKVLGTAPLISAQSNAWDNLPPLAAIDIVGKSETVSTDHPKEAERPCSVQPTTTTVTTTSSTTTTTTAGPTTTTVRPTTTTAPSTTTTAPRTTTTSSTTTRPPVTTTITTPTTTSTTSTIRPTTPTTSTTVTTIRPTTTTSSTTTQPTTTSTLRPTTTTQPPTTTSTTTRPTTTTLRPTTTTTTSTTRPTTTTTSTTTTTAPSTTTTTIRNAPPTAPGRLAARALDRSEIDLSWLASIDDAGVKEYRIDRCEGAGCKDFVEIAQVAAPGFADTGLRPATDYTYKVRAFDGALFSGDSNLASATTLRGQGTAKIDGTLTAGEWDPAARFNVKVALPNGGSTEGTLLVMNDAENLYTAFTYAGKPSSRDLLRVEFDNNHDGQAEEGDDVLSLGPETGFRDEFRTNCTEPASCIIDDLQLRGSRDGAGAFGSQELITYEIAHPLASGDRIHDFTLKPGSTVGFFISISLMDETGKLVQTDFPGFRDYLPLQIE